jgi:probable DNA repair protein
VPSRWVEYFSKILSLFGWPGNQGLDSLEYQQLELWHRTLEEFKTFDLVCKTMHYAEALQLLRDCCHRQISQPQTEDSPIQVLGPLEAAGLAFEHLWLTGMQGTSWPASPRPNPFIPVFLQTQLQMPHATPEREWAFSESLVSGYARACRAMHASYCRQIDGVPEVPSALLSNFVVETTVEASPVSGHWASACSAGVLETLRDEKAPSVGLEAQSAIKGGSGLLEDQSQCPFRAFARHRLQVEPLGTYTIALSAAQRGSLLHNALYALWGEIDDYAALQALDPLAEKQVIVRAVQSAIDAAPVTQRRRLGEAYWQLESRRLASLLHEWLEVERQRSIFAVVQREQDVTLELAHLKIRLRVDRVDQLPDGSRVIIDYKSGKSKVQDWLGERPAKPQLLLYSIAEPGRAAALAFAQVRPRDCRYVGLGEVEAATGISTDIPRAVKAQMDAQDWISLNARWRENLERLANGFIAGEAQVAPLSSSSCTWCGLQPLCRVDAKQEIVEAELE